MMRMRKNVWANVFLILIWTFYTATFSLERFIWGTIVIVLLQIFYGKKMHKSYFSFKFSFRILMCWIKYIGILVNEIWKANLQVAVLVLKPKIELSSGYFKYTPKLKTDFARMVFANSVTLTPGTISVDYDGDELIVHYLTEINMEGFENSYMERILLEMEALKS